MFKIAKSSLAHSHTIAQKSSLLSQSQHLAAATLTRSITTNQMIINQSDLLTSKRKDIFDMYGEIDGNLGVLRMNKEHRYNQLSPSMIENISRGIETMNIDHIITTIFLTTEKNQHFCSGTDFRTIAYMKKEDNYGRIKEYLQQIYNLQTYVAKLNKPLIAMGPGHSYNSGAALLAATAHPLTTLDAKIAFNEVTFGFVPHSGATYYLSRMPGEFGTFMALTGLPINGSDAAQIDLVKGVIHDPKYYAENIADFVNSIEYPGQSGTELFQAGNTGQIFTPWELFLYEKYAKKDELRQEDWNRMKLKQMDSSVREDFVEAKNRIPSATAEAEYKYMQLLRQESANYNTEVGYFDFGKGRSIQENPYIYKNYFADHLDYLKSHLDQEFPHNKGFAIQHRQLIDRCFFSNSVEEIMQNLRKESHPFAKVCLKAMERNSMISMKLALIMLRKATNFDYRKAMELELTVAFNKIQDSDFDLGVQEILMKPKIKGAKEKTAAAFNKKVNDNDLTKYFEESKWSKDVNLGIVENSLLPTRQYYQRFSDQVRLWLNEESTTNSNIRESFDQEAKEALREQGIDVRDKALTPEIARNHLRAVLTQERVQEIFNERSEQLMTDTVLKENYFAQIKDSLQELDGNQRQFYEKVNKHIATIFEDAYLEKLDQVHKKSKEAHSLEKRRMFINFKKFLFRSRILTYDNLEHQRMIKQLQSMPFQQIHLTEKWDQTFREQDHPYLSQSPIYHISKAVGRVSLTQPELIKEYLTNPDTRSAQKLLTLDKKELLTLQQDIIQNPQKYEAMLQAKKADETDNKRSQKMNREMGEIKLQEQEYWFRVINDGRCPLDDFPYAREFQAYKDWADGIESKALDTLRFAVNKLLLDAEQAQDYDGKLLKLKGWIDSDKKKKSKKQDSSLMGDKARPLSEIRTALQNVLRNDPQIGQFFSSQSTNQKIKTFKEETESELLKILEIALLDKYGYVDPKEKHLLEQRLAQLTAPLGNQSSQLNLIDRFLSLRNGEAIVKEAFDVVKPFFLHIMEQKFAAEADYILQELKFESTQPEVMLFYFFNLQFPNSMNRGPLQRFNNFSFKRDANDSIIASLPFLSSQFQRRDLQNIIGKQHLDSSQVLQEIKNSSMNQTKADIDKIQKFDENVRKIELSFTISTEEEKEDFIEFTPGEENELEAMESRLMDLYDYLHFNKYELDNNMSQIDWMHIYSKAILEQGFVFQNSEMNEDQVNNLAEYAQYLKELEIGISTVSAVSNEVAKFLAVHDATNISQEILYKQVIEERNRYIQNQNSKFHVNRESIITGAISDLNDLQKQVELRKKLKGQAVQLAQTLPLKQKKEVLEFLENDQYLNLDQVNSRLQNGDTGFVQEPNQVINVKRFVQDNKKSLKLNFKIDAVSLVEARSQIENDSSLDEEMKQNLVALVQSVQKQTMSLSNADRKMISIKDFLNNYYFQSADAYNLYATDLLKNQIRKRLGQIETEAQPDVMDWQLAETRTHPQEQDENNILPAIQINPVDLSDEEMNPLPEDLDQNVQSMNHETNSIENDTSRDYIYKQLMREARTMTELPQDMESTKNQFENQLLIMMASPDFKESEVSKLIEEYTQIRLRSCLLNRDFAVRVKGDDNGHIFLKVLKEQVVEELGLTKPGLASDLAYKSIMDDKNHQYFNLESAYNLQNVNNVDAMGYDNLMKRTTSTTATENFEMAHETVFDKLLADYFLGKRGEYKESNNLMRELAEVFKDEKFDFADAADVLDYKRLKQDIQKADMPSLEPENFRALIDLDNITQRAIQRNKNGLSDSLRHLSIKDTHHDDHFKTQIPAYFEIFDVRKPASLYVDDKLKSAITELFLIRGQLEKTMTRNELVAFDKVLAKYLQHEVLMPKLKASIDQDYSLLHQSKGLVQSSKENENNLLTQQLKMENNQRNYNKKVVNEDAQFKLLAFNGMLDKQNQVLYENKNDVEAAHSFDNFAQYYKNELRADVSRAPRPIDPTNYDQKKPWEKSTDPFKNKRAKEEDYFKEHTVYLENKKENQERIQMFYILEQFLEAARTKPDQTSKAQDYVKEYFAEPDNTFFFDKNKIF